MPFVQWVVTMVTDFRHTLVDDMQSVKCIFTTTTIPSWHWTGRTMWQRNGVNFEGMKPSMASFSRSTVLQRPMSTGQVLSQNSTDSVFTGRDSSTPRFREAPIEQLEFQSCANASWQWPTMLRYQVTTFTTPPIWKKDHMHVEFVYPHLLQRTVEYIGRLWPANTSLELEQILVWNLRV